MPRAAKGKPLLSVAQIFTKCQEGVSGHSKYAKILWDVHEAAAEQCWKDFCFCLHHLLVMPEGVHVGRVLRFIATFTSQRPEGRQDAADAFVEDIITHLIALARAEDKGVRLRVCQLLQSIVNNQADDGAELSEDVADALAGAMLARLRDRLPAVRCQAALALARLADPGEEGTFAEDEVMQAYLQLLATEKSKDVRKAVLHSLPTAECSLPEILDRTRDVNDEVRKLAYASIRDRVPMEFLSVDQRACLVRRGLQDRKAGVREAAQQLLCAWLDSDAGSSVPSLLHALDVRRHEPEAELAVRCLIEGGRLRPAALAPEQAMGTGLRQDPAAEALSPEEALLWRVDGAATRGSAAAASSGAVAQVEAAAASECLEALERLLPEAPSDLMALVAAHAAAGAPAAFATRQLLAVAARCLDLTDASGRKAAADLVQGLLSDREGTPAQDPALARALLQLAGQVHAAPADLAALLLDSIAACMQLEDREERGEAGMERGEGCWLHCLGLAGELLQRVPNKAVRLPTANPALLGLPDLARRLILPAVEQGCAPIRAEAVRCLGLYSMLPDSPGESPVEAVAASRRVSLLRTALVFDPAPAVQEAAAQALCDLALLRGNAYLDQVHNPLLAHPDAPHSADAPEAVAPILDVLLGRLHDLSSSEVQATGGGCEAAVVVAEGLAKLVLHEQLAGGRMPGGRVPLQDSECTQVLSRLLVLACDASGGVASAAARAQQSLTVFFHAFASAGGGPRLSAAALPAARRALRLGTSPAKSPAPQLLRYVLSLLQMKVASADSSSGGQGEACSTSQIKLARDALVEALACPPGPPAKPYVAALLKLAAGLSLEAATQASTRSREDMKALRALAERAASTLKDRLATPAAKDAAGLASRLAAMDLTPTEGLGEEALQALLQATSGCQDELPFDAEPAAAAPAQRGRTKAGKKPAARKQAAQRRGARDHDSASSDEETSSDSEEGGEEDGQEAGGLTERGNGKSAAGPKAPGKRPARAERARRTGQENAQPLNVA